MGYEDHSHLTPATGTQKITLRVSINNKVHKNKLFAESDEDYQAEMESEWQQFGAKKFISDESSLFEIGASLTWKVWVNILLF